MEPRSSIVLKAITGRVSVTFRTKPFLGEKEATTFPGPDRTIDDRALPLLQNMNFSLPLAACNVCGRTPIYTQNTDTGGAVSLVFLGIARI